MRKLTLSLLLLQIFVLPLFGADAPKECTLCVGVVAADGAGVPTLSRVAESDLASYAPAHPSDIALVVSYTLDDSKDALLQVEEHTKTIIDWARSHGPFDALDRDQRSGDRRVRGEAPRGNGAGTRRREAHRRERRRQRALRQRRGRVLRRRARRRRAGGAHHSDRGNGRAARGKRSIQENLRRRSDRVAECDVRSREGAERRRDARVRECAGRREFARAIQSLDDRRLGVRLDGEDQRARRERQRRRDAGAELRPRRRLADDADSARRCKRAVDPLAARRSFSEAAPRRRRGRARHHGHRQERQSPPRRLAQDDAAVRGRRRLHGEAEPQRDEGNDQRRDGARDLGRGDHPQSAGVRRVPGVDSAALRRAQHDQAALRHRDRQRFFGGDDRRRLLLRSERTRGLGVVGVPDQRREVEVRTHPRAAADPAGKSHAASARHSPHERISLRARSPDGRRRISHV